MGRRPLVLNGLHAFYRHDDSLSTWLNTLAVNTATINFLNMCPPSFNAKRTGGSAQTWNNADEGKLIPAETETLP